MFPEPWNVVASAFGFLLLLGLNNWSWMLMGRYWERSLKDPCAFERSASGRAYQGKTYERVR